ncbi:MAG: sortase A [Oleiphilaceae bacterium]|jgi:sortase A
MVSFNKKEAKEPVMASRLIRYFLIVLSLVGLWHSAIAGKFYAKAWLAEQFIEHAWQASLEGESKVRPWPWADTWPIAEIHVPRLNIRQIILSGDSSRVLAFGPGSTESGILPGEPGLSIVSGHRDTSFNFLKNIQEGDKLIIKNEQEVTTYKVEELAIVDQRYFQIDNKIMKEQHSSILLVTCYPFDALRAGGNKRFVVLANKVDSKTDSKSKIEKKI